MAVGAVIALVQRKDRWQHGSVAGAALVLVALHLPSTGGLARTAVPAACIFASVLVVGALRISGRSGRAVRLALVVTVCALFLATGAAARAIWGARSSFNQGVAQSQRGVDLVRANRMDDAVASFHASGAAFRRARATLRGPLVAPARLVPGLAVQVRALTEAGRTGDDLANAGARIVAANDLDGLRLSDGALPMKAIEGLAPSLESATKALETGLERLASIRSPWLLAPIDERLDLAASKVRDAHAEGEHALVAARLLGPMLGADGPRRYFLALATPAEARGSGGLIGNFAEVTADGKSIDMPVEGRDDALQYATPEAQRHLTGPADFLAHYGRFQPAQSWSNITMSPDFPTTTDVIAQLYPQSAGRPIDGVILLDPIGLAALLKVIGPVTVPQWPVPITSGNVQQILFVDQYVRYIDNDERAELLSEVTKTAFKAFSNAKFASPKALVDALSPAVAGRHILIGSTHPAEMAALEQLGLAGRMPPVDGDALTVVTQNGSGNKIDSFLHRDIRYHATIDPVTGKITARATVTLHNDAPASGLPRYIIGNSYVPPKPSGTSVLYVSVYSPWTLVEGRVDGQKQVFDVNRELGRFAYSRFVEIPPGQSITFELDLTGTGPFRSGYKLDVFHTTQVNPDKVTVDVTLPPGWTADARTGGRRLQPGVTTSTDTDAFVRLALQAPATGGDRRGD